MVTSIFDEKIDRRGTNSLKWTLKSNNELPMWVADMDFKTAPCILDAIKKRADHGIFGYSVIPDTWNKAYSAWWGRRHGWNIDPESLIFCTGVVPAISSLVRKLTTPAEKVLVQTPVYNIFFNSILNNGRFVVESPLLYSNGRYDIDFADLEKKLSDPQVSLMILCNPQNPAGRIWTKDELARIGSLCATHNVTVISDEIHCDIVRPGMNYVPFASVSKECSDNSVICMSPSKCFNIAGLNTAAVSVSNPALRHKVWRAFNTDEIAEPNAFAIQAAEAAFNYGEDWLEQLNMYIFVNIAYAEKYFMTNIPQLKLVHSDATYLLWIDCSQLCGNDCENFAGYVREKSGLWISKGSAYGHNGKNFIRINVACSRSVLQEGLWRLKNAVDLYAVQNLRKV